MRKFAVPLKKAAAVLLAPLLTGMILLTVFACFDIYPLGEKSLSWCDMNQQVVPLLAEFRRILHGEGSFFRSPGAGGINFWGIFFFFLSSPFSLLAAFCKTERLPWLMNVLILLKMMLCAGTGAQLFRRFSSANRGISASLMGVLYAFSGFALLYYQNLVWLDSMALFPLLLLSLGVLERRRNPLPFALVLAAMLTVQYHLAYMVLLFLLFGGGLYLSCVSSKVRCRESAMLLGSGTFTAILLTAAVWLPSFLQILRSARGQSMAENIRYGTLFTPIFTTVPIILTTALPFAAFLFLRRKQTRQGLFVLICGMTVLLFVPLILDPVNRMWHGGSYQGFPARYGYMLNLLMLIFSFWIVRSISPENPPEKSRRIPAVLTGGMLVLDAALMLCALAYRFPDFSVYSKKLWGSAQSFSALFQMMLFGVLPYIVVLIFWKKRQLSRPFFLGAAAVLIFSECFFSSSVYMGNAPTDQKNYTEILTLAEHLPADDDFYRVKSRRKYFDVNLLSAAGCESLAHYTSLTPETTLTGQRRLGYSGYWMELGSHGGTAFTDALLGNRFTVLPVPYAPPDSRTLFCGKRFALVSLPDQMPDAILTSAAPGFLAELPAGSRMSIQNQLASVIFPESVPLFTKYQPERTENLAVSGRIYRPTPGKTARLTWEIPISSPTSLYFDCAAAPSNALQEAVNQSCTIEVNGTLFRRGYPARSENGILHLGYYTEGTVTVTVELSKAIAPESFEVFGLDETALSALCQKAEGAELSGGGRQFSAEIRAEEGQTLFVPLSYDPGWNARINGKKVPVFRTAGCYLSLPLQSGENHITLTYTPPGLYAGLILSASALPLLFLLGRKRRWMQNARLQAAAGILLQSAVLVMGVLVYLLPLILWLSANFPRK